MQSHKLPASPEDDVMIAHLVAATVEILKREAMRWATSRAVLL